MKTRVLFSSIELKLFYKQNILLKIRSVSLSCRRGEEQSVPLSCRSRWSSTSASESARYKFLAPTHLLSSPHILVVVGMSLSFSAAAEQSMTT
jgi:hypothetical protein